METTARDGTVDSNYVFGVLITIAKMETTNSVIAYKHLKWMVRIAHQLNRRNGIINF